MKKYNTFHADQGRQKMSPGKLHILSLIASSIVAFIITVLLIYVSCRLIW